MNRKTIKYKCRNFNAPRSQCSISADGTYIIQAFIEYDRTPKSVKS